MAGVYCLCRERDWKEWKLGWNIRLAASAYTVYKLISFYSSSLLFAKKIEPLTK